MTPIAAWLRAARAQQLNPTTGKPGWSQEYTARRITEETGRVLHRETLNAYENGRGFQVATYEWIVGFWANHGVTGAPPRDAEVSPALSLEERAVLAAEAQVEATRENTAVLTRLLAALTVRTMSPEVREALMEMQPEELPTHPGRTQSPRLGFRQETSTGSR